MTLKIALHAEAEEAGRDKISDAAKAASPLGTREVFSAENLRSARHIFLDETTYATGSSANPMILPCLRRHMTNYANTDPLHHFTFELYIFKGYPVIVIKLTN